MSQALPNKIILNKTSRFSVDEKQAALSRLALEIGLTLDLEQVLIRGLEAIIEVTAAEVGEIFLLEGEPEDPDEQKFFQQAALHAPLELRETFTELDSFGYGEGLPGLAASKRQTIISHKLTNDVRFLRQRFKQQGFHFAAAFPLLVNNSAIGVLNLFSQARNWTIGPEDVLFIEALVASLAIAVNNALSYRRMEQARAGMAALSNAVEILNTSLNPRHVIVRLLSEAVKLIGAEGGAVYLYNPGASFLQPHATILIDPEWRERELPLAGSLTAEVLLTGTIRTVSDTATTPERVYPKLEESGRPGSVVAAPLMRRGQLRGVLECYSSRPRNLSKHQLELLSAFASHAVLALRNAELHQELDVERRKADVERKKFEAILDNSPEGFFFAKPDGTIVNFNRNARQILGLGNSNPENFFQYKRDYQVFRPDGISRMSEEEIAMTLALKEEATITLQEAILRWPEGIEKYLILSAAPIYDERNQMMGAFTLFQDVTPIKQAEKLKSKFLSMITHELKTPLASIKGTISGLLQEDVEWDDVTQKRFLNSIEEDVDGMVALVANLLDMARLEAGFMRPELEECYLSEVAEEAARRLRGLARTAHQRIQFEFEAGTPPVAADFIHLERVMVNLIGNALKYSPERTTVTISVRPTFENENQVFVELAVADQGPGISPDDREKIFKQFYRGQLVANRAGRKVGTGLGLAICREVIALHNGRIWVEDHLGGGSVFKFTLPALVNEGLSI
ncbi:MAG: GAF domain-containing protein [Chloroflexota bacterium]|nr:GAF domain-containing protein [Chloroflexota bacterium]